MNHCRQGQHQHMRGVKRIAGILERLAVVSLPPAVKPDRHEGKQREPLLAQLDLTSEDRDRIHLPAEHHHVEPVQRRELPDKWEYYIDRLSCHIASTGKQYHSHAATIYKWAQEDAAKGKAAPKQGIPDYSCKEGESL